MTTKCGSATPERKKDVLVGLIAALSRGWSVQSRKLAANLDENRYIYFVYGAFDGLSLSCNTVKLGCDILLTDGISSSADAMHDWVLTPAGMAFNIAESALFIGLSAFANYIKDDDKDYVRRQIADYWPYARDAMKALKNGYKGIRSTFQVTSALLGQDLRCMIIPLGVALGVVSMLNRIWYRSMKEERLAMQKKNGETLIAVKALTGINPETYQKYHDSIQRQSESLRAKALLSAAYSGFVDGLYLFMGVGMVTTLLPQFFVAVAVVSLLFSVTCIVTRMYEEYDYQRKLLATQTKIELALCGKELETLFFKLKVLSKTIALERQADGAALRHQQGELMLALDEKMKEFGAHRARLRSQVVLSQTSAALAGLKSGLVVYGAVAGSMFAVAALTAVPPAMVLACVIAGLASLTYFVWRSLKNNAQHLQKQTDAIPHRLASRLKELKEQLAANRLEVAGLEPSELLEAMDVLPSPSSTVDLWGECCRAGASGVKQGQKAADYTLTPMQVADSEGHFQENSFMRWAAIVCSAIFACVLALRALARGFGRAPVDAVHKPSPLEPPSTVVLASSLAPDIPVSAIDETEQKIPKFHRPETDDDLAAELRRLPDGDGVADDLSLKDLPKKRPISATQPTQTLSTTQTSRSPSFLSRFSLFRPVSSVGHLPTLVSNPSAFRTAQGLM